MGNVITRSVVDAVQPAWLWCGHSHEALAAALTHNGGGVTRVACLDEAATPEGAVFWQEWENGRAVEAGWGTSGRPVWRAGEPWGAEKTPPRG